MIFSISLKMMFQFLWTQLNEIKFLVLWLLRAYLDVNIKCFIIFTPRVLFQVNCRCRRRCKIISWFDTCCKIDINSLYAKSERSSEENRDTLSEFLLNSWSQIAYARSFVILAANNVKCLRASQIFTENGSNGFKNSSSCRRWNITDYDYIIWRLRTAKKLQAEISEDSMFKEVLEIIFRITSSCLNVGILARFFLGKRQDNKNITTLCFNDACLFLLQLISQKFTIWFSLEKGSFFSAHLFL